MRNAAFSFQTGRGASLQRRRHCRHRSTTGAKNRTQSSVSLRSAREIGGAVFRRGGARQGTSGWFLRSNLKIELAPSKPSPPQHYEKVGKRDDDITFVEFIALGLVGWEHSSGRDDVRGLCIEHSTPSESQGHRRAKLAHAAAPRGKERDDGRRQKSIEIIEFEQGEQVRSTCGERGPGIELLVHF